MKKIISVLLVAMFFCSAMSGCVKTDNNSGEKNIKILTTFYPITALTANVTKGVSGITLVNLLPHSDGCLHNYTLTTKEMKEAGEADILIINGAGMESFVDTVSEANSDIKIIDSTLGLDVIDNGDEINPHMWMSVSGAMGMVKNIAYFLGEADPKHKADYEKNAENYITELEALKKEMTEGLKGKSINAVSFHEAFDYMAEELGLNIIDTLVTEDEDSSVSSKRLSEVISVINANKPVVLLDEAAKHNEYIDIIAKETGSKVCKIDIVAGSDTELEKAYVTIMEKNLKALKEVLLP